MYSYDSENGAIYLNGVQIGSFIPSPNATISALHSLVGNANAGNAGARIVCMNTNINPDKQ